MYRTLFMAFLCMNLGNTAPKGEADVDITVVKLQPLTIDNPNPEPPDTGEYIAEELPTPSGNTDPPDENLYDAESPLHDNQDGRYERSQDTTSNYESEETTESVPTAEKDERLEELLKQTEEYESRTRPPITSRFFSKLSYFQKPKELDRLPSRNFVERTGKRQFKSKCRCEKISNCPKLQISVPRCPEEYFMCCF